MKFLLVLDDVWTEDPSKWEQLRDSLKQGFRGSKILSTTRKYNVAKIMGTTIMIPLGELPEENCWSLFSQVAFSGRTGKECNKLEDIGRNIVSKCNGLPLAVKTLASLLSLKTRIEQWQNVLDSELWKLEGIEKGLFPPLLLSYYDLSSNLKKCFSYCAVFPKDYEIKKDKLIKLWMAQGYLNVEGGKDMKLICEEYFENLAMRSFFQDIRKQNDDGSIITCKMHDIVHDFAQFLMKNECFNIEVDGATESQLEFSYKNSRHSMIIVKRDNLFPISIYNETKLHSLLVECHGDYLTSNIVSKLLFDKLTCLRALEFSSTYFQYFKSINKVPREIEKLLHLRYLSLRNFWETEELPESLCELYNLQTLDLHYCRRLRKLPVGIGKLINLRHLIIDETNSLRYMPKGMDKLTCLRTLSEFKVSSGGPGIEACAFEIFENLKYLQGSLKLLGLGNVTDVDGIKRADLKSKKKLFQVKLGFGKEEIEGRINKENEVVLEALELPPDLKKLDIWSYESKIISTHWMESLTKLKTLVLHCSDNLEHLPSLGQLPCLESLCISKMKSIRKVGNEVLGIDGRGNTSISSSFTAFPKLKSLKFDFMDNWEEWNFDFNGEDIIIMPSLRYLHITYSSKLKSVPDSLLQKTRLKLLIFHGCIDLEKCYQEGIGEDWHKISHIPDIIISS